MIRQKPSPATSTPAPTPADPAVQAKSDFVAFATHQLRTPLSGVKWFLELAARDETMGEDTRAYIADARDATERLVRLVDEMVGLSRLENGTVPIARQPLRLGDLSRQTLAETAVLLAEKKFRLATRGLDDTTAAVGDPTLVRQVIDTLVSNAIRYTEAGGEITVSLTHDAAAATWSISDTGIGIGAAAQRRIFQPFYRAENARRLDTEGLGLGLCVARLVVERLGGRIGFESSEGRGSTFTFTLPLAEETR